MARLFTTSELLGQGIAETAVSKREKEIQKFDANHQRVQNNLQNIINAGGSPSDMDDYLKLVEGITPGVVPQRPKPLEQASIKNAALALARGSVTGLTGVASIPFMAMEGVGFLFGRAFDEDATFESFSTTSRAIQQGGQEINKFLDPSFSFEKGQEDIERQFAIRATEKVGEFVTPGAGIVMGLTRKGATLLHKAPEALKWWQKALVQMAENPTKAQLVEAGLNMGAAVSGEVAVSTLIDPRDPNAKEKEGYVRFGAEMGSLVGVGVSLGFVNAARRMASSFNSKLAFTENAQKRLGEVRVGEFLNEVAEADGINMAAQAKKVAAIEAETGVKAFTPDLFQNPDLQAGFEKIVQTGHLTATKYNAVLMASRQRLQTYIDKMSPVLSKGQTLQDDLNKFLNEEFVKLDTRLERVERAALEEAMILNPNRSAQDIGETGIEMVKLLEREALDKADALYKALDDGVKLPTNLIDSGAQQAKLNPSFREANIARIMRGEEITDLKGVALNPQVQNLVDVAELNFGKGNPKATLGQIVQFRRMVQDEFRLAAIHGDSDTTLRLGRMLDGVDKQLAKAAKSPRLAGQQAKALQEANASYTALKTRFDKSFEIVGIQKDLSSMYTVAPEDFARKFIRPESRVKSIESAKAFNSIYEGDPQAKALLSDSVKLQLSKLKKGDNLNPAAVSKWLQNHKANLQAHGLWDEFKDIPTTIARLDDSRLAVGMDRKLWERSQLVKVAKVDDVSGLITAKMKSNKLAPLAKEIKDATPAGHRALVREVWDNLLLKSESGALDSGVVNDSGELVRNIIRTPDTMLAALRNHGDDIKQVVGDKHFKSLTTIAEQVKILEGRLPTQGAKAIPEAAFTPPNQKALQSAFSKIRASLQGFVSPQFTAVQLANQGLDVLNSNAAQHVLEEAMYNPEYAAKLAAIAKTAAGKEALRTIWLQTTAYAVAGNSAFIGDDPRTQE